MPGLRVVLAILLKDLEDATRSHTVLLVLISPILLSALFSRAFSQSDLRRPALAVAAPADSGLVRLLGASDLVRLESVDSFEQARGLVVGGHCQAALGIPPEFDRELVAGSVPRLDLVIDEASPGRVALVREVIRSALRQQAGQEIPADLRVEKVHPQSGGIKQSLLPSWVLFVVLSAMMVTSSAVVEELESGTLEQVLAGPVSLGQWLVGKVSTSALLALVAGVLVIALNASPGPGWVTALAFLTISSLVFPLLGAGIGLWTGNQATANALTGLVFLVLFIPCALAEMSRSMGQLAGYSPAFYLYDGIVRALNREVGGAALGRDFAVLLASLAVIYGFSLWRLGKQATR